MLLFSFATISEQMTIKFSCALLILCPFLTSVLLYASVPPVLAESTRARLASDQVLHTPAVDLQLYSKKKKDLSKSEASKIELHGLRMAPLDPRVWAIRRIDQTDSRRLVPIRPYVLRSSDNPSFRLKEVVLRLRFNSVSESQMRDAPSLHSPVFDLEFAGDFQMGLPGKRPAEDSAYVFRFSGSPLFESGFFYRSYLRSKRLDSASYGVTSGKTYELKLLTSESSAEIFLDGKKQAEIHGEDFSQGLLSLIVGWHPIKVESLSVTGSVLNKEGRREFVSFSGLWGVEAKK